MPSPLTLQRALETLAAYSPENPPLSSSDHYFFNEAAWLLRDHYAQVVERTRRRLGMATEQGCYAAWDEATEDAKVFVAQRDAARAEAARLRERHAEAVEAAFRAGFAAGADAKGMAVSWHWSEAKARLT